jgi:hypothetical protein
LWQPCRLLPFHSTWLETDESVERLGRLAVAIVEHFRCSDG